MRSIPLYYAVLTAPHSNQPQASTQSSCRNGRCRQPPEPKAACSPSLWLQLTLRLLPINASSKLQASQNRRPCSAHTDELCLPLECLLLLSIPLSAHPHLSESYILQGQVQIGHLIYERHWLQHQTRFDPWSVAPRRLSCYLPCLWVAIGVCGTPKLGSEPPWEGIRTSFLEPLRHTDRGST